MEKSYMIGVMAIQGAVEEHMNSVRAVGHRSKEIRVPEDMNDVDGIILPGGESTAMAIVGEKRGLFPELKRWVAEGRPIWGTCAGMILLSNHAVKQKEGGQALLGGLDVQVCRNFFGSQLYSDALDIKMEIEDALLSNDSSDPIRGVFIRAPAILTAGEGVEVIASLEAKPHVSATAEVLKVVASSDGKIEMTADGKVRVIVAVQQGNILATAFHPELTPDLRWHQKFVAMVDSFKKQNESA
eukprot:gene19333-13981_t